jgi:hypothetical protein
LSEDTARIVQQFERKDRKHYRRDQIENSSVSKAITNECMALLKEASDNHFNATPPLPSRRKWHRRLDPKYTAGPR